VIKPALVQALAKGTVRVLRLVVTLYSWKQRGMTAHTDIVGIWETPRLMLSSI
jgi:hypothetical protein